jgi:tripartite motif-containing protein 71
MVLGNPNGTYVPTRSILRPRAAATLALAVLAVGAMAFATEASAQAGGGQPNVIVVMTDDQTVEAMKAMPQVRSLIGDQGATFTNNFVNFSLCCPSRATFQTGQYAHNHGVDNGDGFRLFDPSNALPVWLHDAGYRTAFMGKYLNGYGEGDRSFVPPGWDEWDGALPNSQYVYNYDLNENGSIVHYGSAPSDFKGDVLTGKALSFIQSSVSSPQPFFLDLAYTAPHTSTEPGDEPCPNAAKPAPQDVGSFANEPLPQPPSFNEADVSDKPQMVRNRNPLTSATVSKMTDHYRCALASLQYEDRGVAQIVDALSQAGELDSTLILFTSDNGFMNGQHRIPTGKVWPYEESIRVPLLMRGPGVPAGATVDAFATNADLTSTILDAAGAQAGLTQDGESLYNLLSAPGPNRDLLVERGAIPGDPGPFSPPKFEAVRTGRYLYVEWVTGERELYDLASDPNELNSVDRDPDYAPVEAWLARRLEELRTCQGQSCRDSAGQPPPPLSGPVALAAASPPIGAGPSSSSSPPAFPASPTTPSSGGTVAPFAGEPAFHAPYTVAASPSSGDLYVADSAANRIEEFTPGGARVRRWGERGSGQGQFIAPRAVAVAPGGEVYVADTSNNRVQEFAADGTFIRQWGRLGSAAGRFDSPEGIAVAANGDVYVADGGNDRVEQFASDGTFVAAWGMSGTGDGELDSPGAIAVAPSGDLYVTDRGNDRVQEFAADGTFVSQWGGYGSGDGQFSFPRGIAVDPAGDVWVADTVNDRVQEFAADGTFIGAWGSRGVDGGELFNPRGLAIGSNGDVYVADTLNDRLQRFTVGGSLVAEWGSGGGPGQFDSPGGIGAAPNGEVYVADTHNNRIEEFTSDGAFVRAWNTYGRLNSRFRNPHGVAVAPSGNLYVADTDHRRIEEFKADGTYLRRWGSRGTGPGQFDSPRGVAVGANRDVYVTDAGNGRVQEFTSSGTFVRAWTTDFPLSIAAAPSGDLYVASGDDTVKEFTPDGTPVTQWGDSDQFDPPSSVAVASNGDVYVADPASNEVDQFTSTGQFIDSTADSELDSPAVLATTPQLGEILVTSGASAVVRVTDTAPNLTGTVPPSPSSNPSPAVKGVADPVSTVNLYASLDCSGLSLGSGAGTDLSGSGIPITVPSDQTTELRATATDSAGNVSGCSSPISFTQDSTPPETTIDSGPPGVSNDPNPTFTFSSSELRSSFRCKLDKAPYRACSSPKTYAGLADGPHTVRVRATDKAGNVDPTPASWSFTVDTAPPETTIDSGPSGTIATSSADFAFSSSETGARFECDLDGGGFGDCASPASYAGLTEGDHAFQVRAIDGAPNVDPTPAEDDFTVATAP